MRPGHIALAVLLTPLAAAAQGQQYAVQTIDYPGGSDTVWRGLNDAGVLVGSYVDAGGLTQAVMFDGASFTTLDDPTGQNTYFEDVDASGLVLGNSNGPTGNAGRAFTWRAGTYTDLPEPGYNADYTGSNDGGLMIATWSRFVVALHGMVWDGANVTTVDIPGSAFTQFVGTNDVGTIVGSHADPSFPARHGLVYDWTNATWTTLDRPGAQATLLTGVNDLGWICGYSYGSAGASEAFVFDGFLFHALDVPGATGDVFAHDIDDAGVVVGSYVGVHQGVAGTHGFVARPLNNGTASYCAANPNSTGQAARIGFQGSVSVGANDLVLIADGCPAGRNGAFLYGLSQIQTPFGQGFLCVSGNTLFFPVQQTGASGVASLALDVNHPPHPSGQIQAGQTWHFQFLHRDPGAGFNLSDGLTVVFEP